MAYVVTSACLDCKYTSCAVVCPVDCFYQGPNVLVIHPDECIDCGACEPECPVNAIYPEDDVPQDQSAWIQLNAKYAPEWQGLGYNITTQEGPMDDMARCEATPKTPSDLQTWDV